MFLFLNIMCVFFFYPIVMEKKKRAEPESLGYVRDKFCTDTQICIFFEVKVSVVGKRECYIWVVDRESV